MVEIKNVKPLPKGGHRPKPLLGKLAEPFVLKLNEREADTFLANLKDRVET